MVHHSSVGMTSWRCHLTVNQARKKQRRFDSYPADHLGAYSKYTKLSCDQLKGRAFDLKFKMQPVRIRHYTNLNCAQFALVVQLAETYDLESQQCEFESHREYHLCWDQFSGKTSDCGSEVVGSTPTSQPIYAPIVQMAEATDSKSVCCGFDSHLGYHMRSQLSRTRASHF